MNPSCKIRLERRVERLPGGGHGTDTARAAWRRRQAARRRNANSPTQGA
ncbi:hypothetical protein GZL_05307 [Streptomyces sp. 769]|nr:hypothetical protein GZL_05307 [Streptomyces sp. 769]